MNRSDVGSILEGFCLFRSQLILLFAACLLLFGLAGAVLLGTAPGTGAYVISVVNLVTLGVFLVAAGAVLWFCRDIE